MEEGKTDRQKEIQSFEDDPENRQHRFSPLLRPPRGVRRHKEPLLISNNTRALQRAPRGSEIGIPNKKKRHGSSLFHLRRIRFSSRSAVNWTPPSSSWKHRPRNKSSKRTSSLRRLIFDNEMALFGDSSKTRWPFRWLESAKALTAVCLEQKKSWSFDVGNHLGFTGSVWENGQRRRWKRSH